MYNLFFFSFIFTLQYIFYIFQRCLCYLCCFSSSAIASTDLPRINLVLLLPVSMFVGVYFFMRRQLNEGSLYPHLLCLRQGRTDENLSDTPGERSCPRVSFTADIAIQEAVVRLCRRLRYSIHTGKV